MYFLINSDGSINFIDEHPVCEQLDFTDVTLYEYPNKTVHDLIGDQDIHELYWSKRQEKFIPYLLWWKGMIPLTPSNEVIVSPNPVYLEKRREFLAGLEDRELAKAIEHDEIPYEMRDKYRSAMREYHYNRKNK